MLSNARIIIKVPSLALESQPGEMLTVPYSAIKDTGTPPSITVTLELEDMTGVEELFWEIHDQPYREAPSPPKNAAFIPDPTANTATFLLTVNEAGTYRVGCNVNNAEIRTSSLVAVLSEQKEYRYPAVGETKQAGLRGWQKAYEKVMRDAEEIVSVSFEDSGFDRNLNEGDDTLQKVFDKVDQVQGYGQDAIVVVKPGFNTLVNGQNLLDAWDKVMTLTPNGNAIGPSNRAALYIPAGLYTLPAPWTWDFSGMFIDIIGQGEAHSNIASNVPAPPGVQMVASTPLTRIEGSFDGLPVIDSSVFYQYISNLTVMNLHSNGHGWRVASTGVGSYITNCTIAGGSSGYSLYNGMTTIEATFVNCRGNSHFIGAHDEKIIFSGSAINCSAGDYSFGGNSLGWGVLQGRVRDCWGGNNCFGSGGNGSLLVPGHGDFEGKAYRCRSGHRSFGGCDNAGRGRFDGEAYDCLAGDDSFGACKAILGMSEGARFTGKASRCTAGNGSFGVGNGVGGEAWLTDSDIENCKAGDRSFGSVGTSGENLTMIFATFKNCIGGNFSFGYSESIAELNSASFYDCIGLGRCFGHGEDTHGKAIGSRFERCRAGDYAFATSYSGFGECSFGCIFRDCESSNYAFGASHDLNANNAFKDSEALGCKGAEFQFGGTDGETSGSLIKGCVVGDSSLAKISASIINECIIGIHFLTVGCDIDTKILHCVSLERIAPLTEVAGYFEDCILALPRTSPIPALYLTDLSQKPAFYNCTIAAGTSGNPYTTSAGTGHDIQVAHCRLSAPLDTDFNNLIATPYNVIDSNIRVSGM